MSHLNEFLGEIVSSAKRIYLSSPTMNGDELGYVQEAFDTNWVAPLGKNVDGFECELAAYIGSPHAAALSSGTAALHLAVKLAGVRRGDLVFCSDLTFSATVNPVSYEGGIQVFIDSERETWNMDPRALEKAFVKYPACKCVIVANLYGTPAKLDEIKAACEAHNAVLIEDAAESLGATYRGRQTGTFGTYGVFSFNGNKIITTSGGGMLVSEDEKAIRKARFWATQSREAARHYEHRELGYNYRMSNICAGIGCGQMTVLDEHVAHHRHVHALYEKGFADVDGISLKSNPDSRFNANYWLCTILIDPEKTGTNYEEVRLKLDGKGIETRPLWKPMHLQPVYAQNPCYVNGVSEKLFDMGLCIPAGPCVTDGDVEYIVEQIKRCCNG